jgi:hypothetical protein
VNCKQLLNKEVSYFIWSAKTKYPKADSLSTKILKCISHSLESGTSKIKVLNDLVSG